jgi:hypothetical protein
MNEKKFLKQFEKESRRVEKQHEKALSIVALFEQETDLKVSEETLLNYILWLEDRCYRAGSKLLETFLIFLGVGLVFIISIIFKLAK